MPTQHHWSENLRRVLDELGWTVAELARRSGLEYDLVYKYSRGDVDQPRGKKLDQLANALGVDPLWLLKGGATKSARISLAHAVIQKKPSEVVNRTDRIITTIKVRGRAEAGMWAESPELDLSDQYDAVIPIPPGYDVNQLDAFEVRGRSMDRVYPPGTVIVGARIQDVGFDFKPGKNVIVRRQGRADLIEITVKEYSVSKTGVVTLLPRSTSPEFSPIVLDGNDEAEITHIVIGSWRWE